MCSRAHVPRPDAISFLGIIVAMTRDGVIGLDGTLPWRHVGDLRRFKERTVGTTVVMGRLTYESMGSKPLVERRNVVVTSRDLPGVECRRSVADALEVCEGVVWFIGGARIFAEALPLCDVVDVTWVPDRIDEPRAVRFPVADLGAFDAEEPTAHPYNEELILQIYRRRSS